jgi:hypothetical protein
MKRTIFFALFLLTITFARADPSLNLSNTTAEAGNVTYLDINGTSATELWQGYFGTVSGGITLADANGDSFYDWNVINGVGEVLATRSIVVDWSLINCSNQTQIYQEEELLNIPNESNNGVNDTYLMTNHPEFEVGGRYISNCRATKTNNATEEKSRFWNVLLSSNSTNTVYVALLDNDQVGFNGSIIDFQLLVPVDRITGIATYNMYLEIY